MALDTAWFDDEPLDISVVPRTAPPLIDLTGEPAGRRPMTELEGRFGRAIQMAMEIIGGDRPLSQAVRWTSPQVHEQLARRTSQVARAGSHAPGTARVQRVRPRVTGVTTCSPTTGIVEVAVTVRTGQRARAVAAQFTHLDGRWVCTVMDFGSAPALERPARIRQVNGRPALRDTA